MDDALFEQLLHEEEGLTLDFKREQYRFAKAPDTERSELLKDILGFANAPRRADAFILIGVEDVRGGRAEVMGIEAAHHLDDHSLQQFVAGLANRPVRFHYAAFRFEGKQVGVIRIDEEQDPPVHLTRNFGKLKKNEVYVRRGSATDPTRPATPDEIARMGRRSRALVPQVAVEFAALHDDSSLGSGIALEAEFCEMPEIDDIPDLKRPRDTRFGIDLGIRNGHNDDYYRELAAYVFADRFFRSVRLLIRNVGVVVAANVRVELTVPIEGGRVIDPSALPDPPKRRRDHWNSAALRSIRSRFRSPGEVDIDTNDDRSRIVIECGTLQPGRTVRSEPFCVGKDATGEIVLAAWVFADNLPRPTNVELTIAMEVAVTRLTLRELMALPEPAASD
jgi:schlafen family protein